MPLSCPTSIRNLLSVKQDKSEKLDQDPSFKKPKIPPFKGHVGAHYYRPSPSSATSKSTLTSYGYSTPSLNMTQSHEERRSFDSSRSANKSHGRGGAGKLPFLLNSLNSQYHLLVAISNREPLG
jgi:hypothetical protein